MDRPTPSTSHRRKNSKLTIDVPTEPLHSNKGRAYPSTPSIIFSADGEHSLDNTGLAREPRERPATFVVPLTPAPRTSTYWRKNKVEQGRLQGLMKLELANSDNPDSEKLVVKEAKLTGLSRIEEWQIWMVNEGSRKVFFGAWCTLQILIFGLGSVNYRFKDNLAQARANFGVTYEIARAAALVLHVDVALILLPVCRSFISYLRRGPLNGTVPFEKSITFRQCNCRGARMGCCMLILCPPRPDKSVAWSMVFFTLVHTFAHLVNAWWLASEAQRPVQDRVRLYFVVLFTLGPMVTGWIMLLALGIMVWFALESKRRQHFERYALAKPGKCHEMLRITGFDNRFWYSHHLMIVLFVNWQAHGMFCLIKPDRPPYCSPSQIGVFWKYWLVGGIIYLGERTLREIRARRRTYISKVILHPSDVYEIQIKMEKMRTKPGQYIFLNCPEVSYWQWHPFTLTSAPEEDYLSVHIRIVGDFTSALAESLGCAVLDTGARGIENVKPPLKKVMPRIMVDGPFGSASEDIFKFEVSMLVGAGIGVTPFASILKSIWYRLNFPQEHKRRSRSRRVYAVQVGAFEWFQSLLQAIEDRDTDNSIEIHTYLTAPVQEDDLNNIFAHDVGGTVDAVTNLRAPTHYGRPNWDRIFQSIAEAHPSTETGVFFCGPKPLGSTLHKLCNKYTQPGEEGVKFHWGKVSRRS
ncbi:BQ2448_4073 [Microbotryum intermedium]|uniref:BQ2448_4073 protein n=1 Tax=Microbotryum intermedium TaxID=269621 RepID=A0A238FN86_9BASI|nr:BQ2448_4073 [Microbotryum intermedium]